MGASGVIETARCFPLERSKWLESVLGVPEMVSVRPGDRPSVKPGDLFLTSANFPCCRENFHHFFPSTSIKFLCGRKTSYQHSGTFYVTSRISVNLLCGRETFRQLLSAFRAARRLSVNFRQLSVRPGDLLLTSMNFLCGLEIFHQHLLTFRAVGRPSVNFLSTFCTAEDLPTTFCVDGRHSVNFRQPSMRR